MKIAIISFYCLESSIPLAKYLTLNGSKVDLFALLSDGDQNTYVIDFSIKKQPIGFIDIRYAMKTMNKKLIKYLSSVNTQFFVFPSRWYRRIFFQEIFSAFKLAKQIKRNNYDIIHVIHTSKRFWIFLFLFIEKKKMIQTLHEVTAHDKKKSLYNKIILYLLNKYSISIIFHSVISKERFIEYQNSVYWKNPKIPKLTTIRFGLFETYKLLDITPQKTNSDKKYNILNFGRIVRYKGIDILIDAIKILQEKYPIHLIVAGEGDPYFDFIGLKSFEFINRSISDHEIVKLINECDIVVLPYTSASQSGIPMTVFPFKKPIITSNIAGFKEIIDDKETGLLVNNITPESFAESIEFLISNNKIAMQMTSKIEKKYNNGEFSWQFIANSTFIFYQEHLETV